MADQPVVLSDGKEAVVDKRDALHIANKAATKKMAQIAKIKELVERAELYAEDKNVTHNKFNYFCYYRANVNYQGETFPIYLNVGKGTYDGKYHVYDITNKIRDTADRINGLERPATDAGGALTSDISNNSIRNPAVNVNKKDLSADYQQGEDQRNSRISEILDSVSTNHAAQFEKYAELLNTDPEQAERWAQDLENGPYFKEFEEYQELIAQQDKAKENTAKIGGERYSFHGYAEDGKGIYESNFPKGTPKKAKGERILRYIQDVWSKKPITLRIESSGEVRYIEAKFDPSYSEDENSPTDASKLMGGNRHGNAVEKRVTLDLADDYYQIASESRYNYSKAETGKNTDPHQGVKQWHYFVNDIYFAEYGSEELVPYRVFINVKEKADGNYFYSFSAEQAEGTSTQRTLHAAVNGSNKTAANGSSLIDSIRNPMQNVNQKYLDAVNRGDVQTAQQMVDEAAKNAGYNVKVFHGTDAFGFTKLDVSKSDDGISFFATDR